MKETTVLANRPLMVAGRYVKGQLIVEFAGKVNINLVSESTDKAKG